MSHVYTLTVRIFKGLGVKLWKKLKISKIAGLFCLSWQIVIS